MIESKGVVTIISGAIIMMITTDMYHHCGPRVAFMAAIKSGKVCALAVDKNSAIKYSFQHRINTRRKVAASPGFDSKKYTIS